MIETEGAHVNTIPVSLFPQCSLTHCSFSESFRSTLTPRARARSAIHRRTLNQMGIKLCLESRAQAGRAMDRSIQIVMSSGITVILISAPTTQTNWQNKQETSDTFL